MNDIEKRLKLNIDIPNEKSVDRLNHALTDIEKKIANLNKKAPSSESSQLLAQLTATKESLEAQIESAQKLADIFDRIGKGQKVSAEDQKTAAKYLNDQVKAAREANAYKARLDKFAEGATRKQSRAALQSDLMRAGFSMADANKYSAQGLDAEAVKSLQSGAKDSAIGVGNTVVSGILKGARGANDEFKKIFGFSLSIKDNFKTMLDNVGDALNATSGMASYSTGTSLFTNRSARELQLRYGLNSSQAYGFQQASDLLGLNTGDLSDYAYMNERQRQVFSEYMRRSSAWYDKLTSSGALDSIQEMQLEFSLMKQELSMQFLSFIAENKDTIMALLQGIFNAASGILSLLPSHSTTRSLIGASASLGVSSNSTTYNIKVESNNSASGVMSNQDSLMDQFNQWGNNLASQIVAATGG